MNISFGTQDAASVGNIGNIKEIEYYQLNYLSKKISYINSLNRDKSEQNQDANKVGTKDEKLGCLVTLVKVSRNSREANPPLLMHL